MAALETQSQAYTDEIKAKTKSGEFAGDLLNWNNRSHEALVAKKSYKRLQTASRMCDSAISKIVDGDYDSNGKDGRDLTEWYEARDTAKWAAREAEFDAESARRLRALTDKEETAPTNRSSQVFQSMLDNERKIADRGATVPTKVEPNNIHCPRCGVDFKSVRKFNSHSTRCMIDAEKQTAPTETITVTVPDGTVCPTNE